MVKKFTPGPSIMDLPAFDNLYATDEQIAWFESLLAGVSTNDSIEPQIETVTKDKDVPENKNHNNPRGKP